MKVVFGAFVGGGLVTVWKAVFKISDDLRSFSWLQLHVSTVFE